MKNRLVVISVVFCSMASFAQTVSTNDPTHCQSLLEKENPLESEHFSSAERSDLEFCRISNTMDTVALRMSFHDKNYNFWKTFRNETVPLWFDLRDAYCEFHPDAHYLDFFGNVDQCPHEKPVIHTSRDELEKLFNESETGNFNMQVFIQEQNCNGEKECLQKQVNALKPAVNDFKHSSRK
jgi:hypothetical protein